MNELYIKNIRQKGRGVFCSSFIKSGEVIEVCPLIVLPGFDYDLLYDSFVKQYCFSYNVEENQASLAMGFGCLYNHACPSNAYPITDDEEKIMSIIAVRDIAAHEEITINYSGGYNNESLAWFENRGIVCIK